MDWLAALDQEATVLHDSLPALIAALEWVAGAIDIAAILVILIGATRFILAFARAEFALDRGDRARGMNAARMVLGRYILAGLEVFIVADVIRVALRLEFAALIFLGVLVLIRTVISFALDREMMEIRKELGE